MSDYKKSTAQEPKRRGLQSLDSKMTDLLKPLFAGSKKEFLIINNLVKNWEKIVGKKYVQLCHPKSVNFAKETGQAKLTIIVYNSAIGFFLKNNSEIILEKIASLYGFKAIHRIIIKEETAEIKTKIETKLSADQENSLQEKIKNIADKDLAESLALLGREIMKPK